MPGSTPITMMSDGSPSSEIVWRSTINGDASDPPAPTGTGRNDVNGPDASADTAHSTAPIAASVRSDLERERRRQTRHDQPHREDERDAEDGDDETLPPPLQVTKRSCDQRSVPLPSSRLPSTRRYTYVQRG